MQTMLVKKGIVTGLSLSMMALSVAAVAQDSMLEEVVVTASKRSLALEDLAGAANVLGADKIGPGGDSRHTGHAG